MHLALCTQRPCSVQQPQPENIYSIAVEGETLLEDEWSLQLHPAESEAVHDRGGAERSVFHCNAHAAMRIDRWFPLF